MILSAVSSALYLTNRCTVVHRQGVLVTLYYKSCKLHFAAFSGLLLPALNYRYSCSKCHLTFKRSKW